MSLCKAEKLAPWWAANSGIIPMPDMDLTKFFSADKFHYEAERDVYLCPAGEELRFDRPHSTEHSRRHRARAKDCNHFSLKAKCTTSKQGYSLCRSVDEACLDRVRAYQSTEAYKKALRKRQAWVEPLFASVYYIIEKFKRQQGKLFDKQHSLSAFYPGW